LLNAKLTEWSWKEECRKAQGPKRASPRVTCSITAAGHGFALARQYPPIFRVGINIEALSTTQFMLVTLLATVGAL